MESIAKKIGARIAARRHLEGLTQARLAEKVGVVPETISRLETGAAMPSLASLISVAAELRMELHELFRVRLLDGPRDRAVEKLIWVVSARSVTEIDLVATLAATVFAHIANAPPTAR